MFNLYTNAIDQNGFMGLVSNNVKSTTEANRIDSRKIVSGFAIMSLAVTAVIARGAELMTYSTSIVV
ncbi:MAG: hypothetical protein P8H03_08620 [Emcibacteraceae bacterium]|nr:hypothetical protein [Emcibacteraceae bacterium]